MPSWTQMNNNKKRRSQPAEPASGASRDQSLLSKKMQYKGVSRDAAYKKAHMTPGSNPNVSVQPASSTTVASPADNPIIGPDGSVVGTGNSGITRSPSDATNTAYTRHVLAQRVGLTPRGTETNEHPFAHGSPPQDAADHPNGWPGVPNPVNQRSHKKLSQGFHRSNRLRQSFK